MKEELKIKEKSLLRTILREHKEGLEEELNDSRHSKKDKQAIKKEMERVDDIVHKLGL